MINRGARTTYSFPKAVNPILKENFEENIMEPNKKISANQKQSSALLTFVSVYAIAVSTLMIEIQLRSKNYGFVPTSEQQSLRLESVNLSIESNTTGLEEIDLDKEWEGILGDKSKQELLAYAPPGV
jgi:hypothetical protein